MASDKKPSMYSNRGAIGPAEELEAYGVWVKSEPQDFTASLAEAANFNADALPYEADFDTGFDDMGMGTPGFGMLESDLNIPEISVEDDGVIDQGSDEASTQLLRKIAGELSSIRSELNTLKREFAEIRGGAETEGAGEANDKIEDFFTAADLSAAEDLGFDPGREADEAALKELEAQNETAVAETPEEEIHIDFENLGIDLDGAGAAETVEEETPQELPPLEGLADDDDFEMPTFDPLSFEEAPPPEPGELEEAVEFAQELVPLEGEDEELQALRLEGAESLASPPDNADYLEADPFANENALSEEPIPETVLDDTVFDDVLSVESAESEAAVDETAPEVAEPAVDETAAEVAEPAAGEESEDLAFEGLSFDEAGFDLGEEKEESKEPVVADDTPLDISDAVIDEPKLSEEIAEPAPEEPVEPVEEDISFADDISLDMGDFETDIGLDATTEEPAAEEIVMEEPAVEEPAAEEEAGAGFELDVPADDLGAIEIDTQAEEPAVEEPAVEEPAAAEEEAGAGFELDASADDFGTVDFGEDIALDMQADNLETVDLGEDIALDTQMEDIETVDFGADLEPAAELEPAIDLEPEAEPEPAIPPTKAAAKPAAPANDIISDVDDSVIPEGFEVNAKEADPSVDDDLEAFAGELAITEDESPSDSADKLADDSSEFSAIPVGLKNELKNVLSYMDHLLESLPEEKIEEFAQSEYFDKYKKIFKELGLV